MEPPITTTSTSKLSPSTDPRGEIAQFDLPETDLWSLYARNLPPDNRAEPNWTVLKYVAAKNLANDRQKSKEKLIVSGAIFAAIKD